MSLYQQVENGNRALQCDICKNVSFVTEGWHEYGSILHQEECPDDLLHVCSDKCKDELYNKIRGGEFRLPVLKNEGYYCTVTRKREGY